MRSSATGYRLQSPLAQHSSRAEGSGAADDNAMSGSSRTLGLRIALIVSVSLAIAFALVPSASANDFLAYFTQCDRPDATSCLNDQGGVTPPFPVGTTFTIQIIPGAFGGCDGQGNTASVVDWGDDTPATTGSDRALHTHTYEHAGSFVITMACGGYVHPFDPLPIGGGAFSLGVFGLPETLRPALGPIVIVGAGAAIAAMSLPLSAAAGAGAASGLATAGVGLPGYEPVVASQTAWGPSPIEGGGQPITGLGAHVGPIDVPPPPNPPLGPDDQTLVTCWRHPDGRCGPTPWRTATGEQQWRWGCPHGHYPWGTDYPTEYRLWKAGGAG